MEYRLKFASGRQKVFVEEVVRRSGLKVEDLAKIALVSPRTIRDWRRGKFNISLRAAESFSNRFKVPLANKESLINKWIVSKKKQGRKGGLVFVKKYGPPGTTEGRKKGGSKVLNILREKGVIPPINIFNYPGYSPRLAELVGILLGDGSIEKLKVGITLNSIADKEYSSFVIDLCYDLFGKLPKTRQRMGVNAVEIYYYGVNLVNYLLKIGLIMGNKVRNQVGVPDWITANDSFKISSLRGLVDTDGGIFIHRYKVSGKEYSYKKLCFTNRSVPLLLFVHKTLVDIGLTPKLVDKVENKKVWLYNSDEVRKYLEIVGSHNRRLTKV